MKPRRLLLALPAALIAFPIGAQPLFTDASAGLPTLPFASNSMDVEAADLDGDADLDLVVVGVRLGAGLEPAPIQVHQNDGAGHFARADDLLANERVLVNGLGIEVADVNGDRHPDLYFADRGGADRLFIHTGTATQTGEAPEPARPGLELFPNPARDDVTVRYALAEAGAVKLDVVDALGRVVRVAVNEVRGAGPHNVRIDGRGLPAGVYTGRLQTGGQVTTRRMVRVR